MYHIKFWECLKLALKAPANSEKSNQSLVLYIWFTWFAFTFDTICLFFSKDNIQQEGSMKNGISLSMFCLIDLLKIFVALYLISFNPFVANAPFLCPRKYQKTLEGCRKGALGTNGSIEIIGSHWKKLQW